MIVHFNGHNYETSIISALRTRWIKYFGSYSSPCNMFISHGDGCCDYWQPMTIEDIMNDDIFTAKKQDNDNE